MVVFGTEVFFQRFQRRVFPTQPQGKRSDIPAAAAQAGDGGKRKRLYGGGGCFARRVSGGVGDGHGFVEMIRRVRHVVVHGVRRVGFVEIPRLLLLHQLQPHQGSTADTAAAALFLFLGQFANFPAVHVVQRWLEKG